MERHRCLKWGRWVKNGMCGRPYTEKKLCETFLSKAMQNVFLSTVNK